MMEVLPETTRKFPIWPDENTHEELLGVLRSDQAEAFRYKDTWYPYWAGRYATSENKLGRMSSWAISARISPTTPMAGHSSIAAPS